MLLSRKPPGLIQSIPRLIAAAWSPDGSKVAVTNWNEDGNLTLYTMNSDGTNLQTIFWSWCVPGARCD